MIAGPSVEWHHWVPRSEGGRESAPLHRVCHRMIHRLFDHATLARHMTGPEALRAHPEMARFLAWVRKQPPAFVARTEPPGRRGRRRTGRG
ncbi:HNH endonuclease [Roseospira navarrensis]|uniref:HNH endonuclease n=1 Tax=Roseospira navarrensis TaxID=140058 RepID=A0A7X1ZBP4_9PROT|nr:HNH endonuclease [Roseospira navarrensis]MQX35578.1 HNH endonuclease [Roseospira navarrensis]